ncbi:phosphomannomutase CpsG [Citrobacter werkmanii]|nr:phosphomannomutase CpsG [Citrobacter werkmanii]CAC9258471.1 phosphomannomutase CpsG [Citrobacter werkmanii]
MDVLDIGMSGTEEIYFATFHLGVDGGIEVTASHNPLDYNGMKLVREGRGPSAAIPVCATCSVWRKRMTSRRWMRADAAATSGLILAMPISTTCWVTSIPAT